jgi:glycosyltransferase involved in cell wall biosynthesis
MQTNQRHVKICVYKDSLSVGRGADKAVKNFAAALFECGHDARLVERGGLDAALEERWDAIIATGSNEAVDLDQARYFERTDRAPVILQLHLAPRGFFKWKHPLRNLAIRHAFRKVDAAQVLCSDYAKEFAHIAPGVPVKVIGNFTEFAGAQSSNASASPSTVLYPAAVVNKVKNQRLLIDAFALVAGDFPGWKVRLLGRDDTPYAKSCRRLVTRLGLVGRVEFVGFTCNLGKEYTSSAFIAFPSTLEGFPLALLEAASCGLCALAHSALPGVSDIVSNGKTGLVVNPTVDSYAEGLKRLMADAPLRRSLGENARAFCAKEYSRTRILEQWNALLSDLTR